MMLVPPATFGARGTSLINTLSNLGLLTNLQGCYDYADVNCYPGSGQNITDLSGAGNGLFLGISAGNSTLDPVFSGVAGRLTSSDVFQTAGSYIGGSQPSWMQAVHKDNGKISIAQWTRTTSGSYSMGGISTTFNDSSASSFPGWAFGIADGVIATLGFPVFAAFNNAGTVVGKFNGTAVVGSGNWMFSACAINEQAGTAVIQIDSTQYTGTISYASPTTSDSPNHLLMTPSAASAHDKAMLSFWNVALSAANLDAIYKATKARFGF